MSERKYIKEIPAAHKKVFEKYCEEKQVEKLLKEMVSACFTQRAQDPKQFFLQFLQKRLNLDDENEKLKEQVEKMKAKAEELREELETLKKNHQENPTHPEPERRRFNDLSGFVNPFAEEEFMDMN